MAFLLSSSRADSFMVLEDPRNANTVIYFQGYAHDLSTLAPIFGKTSITSTDGEVVTQFGDNSTVGNTDSPAAGYPGYALALSKPVTTANHHTDDGSVTYTDQFWSYASPDGDHLLILGRSEVDYSFIASMDDANYPARNCQLWSDGSDTAILWTGWRPRMGYDELVWSSPGSSELWDIVPSYTSAVASLDPATSRDRARYQPRWYFDIDTGNGVVAGLGNYLNTHTTTNKTEPRIAPGGFSAYAKTNFPNLNTDQHTGFTAGYSGQFLGISATNTLLYFLNNSADDKNQKIYTYNPADNTGSYLQEFSTVRAASGSSAGGDRDQNSDLLRHTKLASSLFDDPNTANTKGFYVPYFDTNNDYHPYYFQWDTTNDTFTRNEDISVTDDGVSNLDASSQYFYAAVGETLGMREREQRNTYLSSVIFNETFVVSGTRYLTMGILSGIYQRLNPADNLRTYITYEVNASDPKILTYHSHFSVPAQPQGFTWLNDAKTLFGIITENSFYMYSFNSTTGWEQSGEVAKQFWAVGRDRQDRIFGVATSSSTYPDLHVITPALPVVVNITPESETYNYQGATINTFITLDAVNAQGNRTETDVTLVIDGSTITFSDDTTSKIVTTSSSAAVQVPIKIVAAGFSNIVSSVTV